MGEKREEKRVFLTVLLTFFAESNSQNYSSWSWIQSTHLEGIVHRENSLLLFLTYVTGRISP